LLLLVFFELRLALLLLLLQNAITLLAQVLFAALELVVRDLGLAGQ
jgi:hypothetical protein